MRFLWKSGRWLVLGLIVAAIVYQWRFSPTPVETVSVDRMTVMDEVMGTGTLEARVSTTISPKISGRIAQVHVDQGEQVYENKLLVQLDDDELQQQVAIAAANVDAAQAALVRLKADKERAIAVFEQAQKSHTRIAALSEKGAATPEDLDRATESLSVSAADLARAEAAITEGQKGLVAAEKTLEYHRARLADTTIQAPFPGLVIARHREAGDIAVPGSAILTLISTDVLWISAWVDETQMSKLAVSQPVRVIFRSEPKTTYPGTVIRLGKQADRETREFIVDIQVAELPENWTLGQRAEVLIETGQSENALTIPPDVLVRQGDAEGVFVVEQGVARWRPVTFGIRGRESIEVLDGVTAEDVIIRPQAGGSMLREGRRVNVP